MSAAPPMPARLLTRLLWLLTLPVLAAFLIFFAYRSANVLLLPHQVEYGEGPVLEWASQLAQGQLPYKSIESFPWFFSVYTPGYLAASALLLRLLPDAPWVSGRLLSLLSALLLAALLALAQPAGGGKKLRLLPALLWLASPYLFRWATFYRPDLFALLGSALGLLLTQRALERERPTLLPWAAGCFILSFWSKQSFFAAPLAALLTLALLRRDWLPRLLLAGLLGGLLVALPLWAVTGNALLENLVAANANPFSWQTLWRFEHSFVSLTPILLALAALPILQSVHRSFTIHNSQFTIHYSYFLLSLLVTLSVGKAGAWENYFLEPLWAMCALAGHTLARWHAAGGWRRVAVPALVLFQLALFVPGFERRSMVAEAAWLAEQRTEGAALRAALAPRAGQGAVWSEQMGVLAELGEVNPLHSFVYTQLERQGLWEPAPLVARLASGEGMLVQRHDAVADPLKRDRWSRAMLDAGERGFALGTRAGQWQVRPPQPFPDADAPQPLDDSLTLLTWMVLDCRTEPCVPLPRPVELTGQERLTIHLLWRSEAWISQALTASVQLFAPDGTRVGQHDAPVRGGLGGDWPAGALVRDEHELALPTALPPGGYTLRLSLYESEMGQPRGTTTLSRLKISPPPPAASLAVPAAIAFGETLRLVGHDALPVALTPGSTLPLQMQWESVAATNQPLTAFLHLVAPDGTLAAQMDFPPPYPPALWHPGERVELTYPLPLPNTLPPGEYELRVGWYHSDSLARLPATGANTVDGALRLGTVRVPPN